MTRFERRAASARTLTASLAALLLLAVIVAIPAAAATIVVRPGDLDGVDSGILNSGLGGVRTNDNGGTLGEGAWVMDTGSVPIPDSEGNRVWVGTHALDGELFGDLELLEYRTFIRPSSTADDGLSPWIRIEVDLTGDGDRDIRFEWIPLQGTQGAVVENTWQTWEDLVNEDGWRWFGGGNEGLALGFDPMAPTEFEPLQTYMNRAPNARIFPWDGLPSITLRAGQAMPASWIGLVSEVDGLRWQLDAMAESDIIDFEPPTVTTGDVSATQASANANVTVNVPFTLSGINGAESTTAPGTYGGVVSTVDWTLSDTMGVVDSGSVSFPVGTTAVDESILIPEGRIPDAGQKAFTLELSVPAGGNAAVVDDTATVTVAGYGVANLTPPSISGPLATGAAHTVVPGTYSGGGTLTRSYQWQVCTTTSTGSCSDIPGATATTYIPDVDDIDRYLRVRETVANGTVVSVFSAIVGPIVEGIPETVVLVNPSTGQWNYYNPTGQLVDSIFFGNPGDYPIFGDWDGDGIATPGLYRQSDGFVYLRNSNTQGVADIQFFFGNPGDVPLAGDFDGDGFDTVSIYRPTQGQVFVINELGQNNGGLGPADYSYYFGNPGDKPFTGDFNGNGVDSVGLHRESTGFVYFRLTNTQGVADNEFFFGDPGDRFVAGDWTTDGISTPALFRPSNTTMFFRYTNTQGNADFSFVAGQSNWIPVAGYVGN